MWAPEPFKKWFPRCFITTIPHRSTLCWWIYAAYGFQRGHPGNCTVIAVHNHGRPSTQPNRIAYNLVIHHWAARLCATRPDSNVSWPKVGPTSVLSSQRWANVSLSYIVVSLVRLWRGLPHTGDVHNGARTPPIHWVVCSSVVCC